MNPPPPQRSNAGKWLLRIFLGCFLIAVAAPVCLALAILTISGDTRALRNSVVKGDDAQWHKKVELNIGSVPFAVGRMVVPFLDIDPDAKLAVSAVRALDVSVYELKSSEPNRARILTEADARMNKRGWDRAVAALNNDATVAVYTKGKPGDELKVSVLVLNERNMVAVTGSGRLEPVMEIAMRHASKEGLLARVQ